MKKLLVALLILWTSVAFAGTTVTNLTDQSAIPPTTSWYTLCDNGTTTGKCTIASILGLVTPTTLGLVINTNVQAHSSYLDTFVTNSGVASNSSALNGHADTYFQVAGSFAPASGSANYMNVPASPAANVLWGFDNTDGTWQKILFDSSLTYTHSTHTLSATGIYAGTDGTYGVGVKNNTSTVATPSGFDGIFGFVGGVPSYRYGAGTVTALQPSLGLLAGTMTNTYLCTYTTSGTLLSCNTNPASFQAALTNPLVAGTLVNGDYCTKNTATNTIDCNSGGTGSFAGGTLTSALIFRAGSTAAGTAPAYFQAGSLLTTPVAHAFEWDGSLLYVTTSTPTRKTIAYTDSALSGNTSGTAANLSGTPALPSGTTATTQSADSNDTKLATDAYVDSEFIIIGSGLTAGRSYYLAASTGTLTEADATSITTLPNPAICVATSTTVCRRIGKWTTTGLTAGSLYYVPVGGGAVSTSKPTASGNQQQAIGQASSSTTLEIWANRTVIGF